MTLVKTIHSFVFSWLVSHNSWNHKSEVLFNDLYADYSQNDTGHCIELTGQSISQEFVTLVVEVIQ